MSGYELMKPEEITAEDFNEALEILPPTQWRTMGTVESFTSPEPVDTGVYERFVRIRDRYWKMLASINTPINDLAAACRNAEKAVSA